MAIKFGIFSVADHYPAESPRPLSRWYGELLEQAEAADALGFDSFWVAEHHFHEYGAIPRPAVFLSAAAMRTRRIRLGSAVTVLPFDNPLRTAEDFAMLDQLSGGRVNLGIGSGYLAHEYAGFGVNPAEKRQRFDEAFEIMQRAWSGERFSFEGTYHQFKDIQLNVLPVQRPMPATWIALLSQGAAYHVGRKGFPMMMIPYATTEVFSELNEMVGNWKKGYEESESRSAATALFGLHCYCAEDKESAIRGVRESMDRYVRTRLYAKQRPLELLMEKDLVAFGGPEDIARIAKRYEAAGLTHFLAIMNFGAMPHEAVLRSMERLAREVFPLL